MTAVRTLSVIVALLVGAALACATAFIVGVRARDARVLRLARKLQRDLLNPGALRDAGTAGSPHAVVRAPGRVSGRIYDTPVGVNRVGDDLFIPLVYGEGTQWLRNVRAAGGATVLYDGREIVAIDPELVSIVQMPMTAADRIAVRVFGVTHALRLRAAASVPIDADA